VALSDQHTRVVHRLGKTKLEDLGLEAALKKVLDL
jgi:signal transduction histidine kinase